MPERLKTPTGFDVLGDILDTLRMRGSIFFRSELASPWGLSLGRQSSIRFHVALAGNCFISADGAEAVQICESDVVLLARGGSHWIADQPGRQLISSEAAGDACELGNPLFQEGDITHRLLCGVVQFDQTSKHPFLDALPELLHFPRHEFNPAIWMTINVIDQEMGRNRGGAVVDRLTEALFLQLLNEYVGQNKDSSGFLAALRDRRVHQALGMIHADPAFPWTPTLLGERTGMSRATLNRRFQDTVGMAPMAYIGQWRTTKAYQLLVGSNASLEQIAESVGFSSARTLSKAFQRQFDVTPGAIRRAK